MEDKDIVSKIKEMAYENVNKKIEEERKLTEEKINNELQLVSRCIDLINDNMVFKVIDGYNKHYVLATPEMFFEDYSKEPKFDFKKGIKFYDDKHYYDPWFIVNDEKYYDVRYIIGRYAENWGKLKTSFDILKRQISIFENEWNEMLNDQKNVKEVIEEYNRLHVVGKDYEEE